MKASGMKAASLPGGFAHLKGFFPGPWPAGAFRGWKWPPRNPLRSLERPLGADTRAWGRSRCPRGGRRGTGGGPSRRRAAGAPNTEPPGFTLTEVLGVWRELLQKALGGRVGGLAQLQLRLCAGPRAAVRQGVGT